MCIYILGAHITFTSANFPFVTECGVCALCTSNMWWTVWTTGSYGVDIHAAFLYLCLYLLHNSCISYGVNEAPYPSGDCRGYKCIVCSYSIQFGMFQRMRFTNNLTGNRNIIVMRNIGSDRIGWDWIEKCLALFIDLKFVNSSKYQGNDCCNMIQVFGHQMMVYSKEMNRTKTYFP